MTLLLHVLGSVPGLLCNAKVESWRKARHNLTGYREK